MPDSPPNTLEIAPGLVIPLHIIDFTFARSSGPGGQNVNKLNTKATLSLRLDDLVPYIPPGVLARLRRLAVHRTTDDGRLILSSEEFRSQHANKAGCLEKLRHLILQARVAPKPRRKTKPSRGAKERRLQSKKQRGQIKHSRQQRFE